MPWGPSVSSHRTLFFLVFFLALLTPTPKTVSKQCTIANNIFVTTNVLPILERAHG
jgi:hypothetical protein